MAGSQTDDRVLDSSSNLDNVAQPLGSNQLLLGDCRKLGVEVPDNSVGIIVTDPPYLKKFLYLYTWLARFALRVLQPGGYLIAYGGAMFIPDVCRRMGIKGLNWFWLDPLLHSSGWPRMWSLNLMSGYKPIFIYTKGKPKYLPHRGTVHTDKRDKRFHEWGQGSGMAQYFLELLTEPEDLVLDPMAGGGAFLSAAKALGRPYLGFEKDPKAFEVAQNRLTHEQFPLFSAPRQEQQLKLEWLYEEVEEVVEEQDG